MVEEGEIGRTRGVRGEVSSEVYSRIATHRRCSIVDATILKLLSSKAKEVKTSIQSEEEPIITI